MSCYTYENKNYNQSFQPPPYQPYQPYQPYHVDYDKSNEEKLKDFFRMYEISPLFQEDIHAIKKYDIVIICDDSGSMVEPSTYLSLKTNKMVTKTRWDELQETVENIVELCILLDDDGIDIWFLNRDFPIKNVTSKDTVMQLFNKKPCGRTPLTRVTERVMMEPSNKPKLILIITDGEPNNDDGYPDCDNFLRLLKKRNVDQNRISILACTSSDSQMDWLERVDKEAKHVDVVDDYLTEREQILKIQGQNFSYSHGDHILKMLLGPIFQKYDDLDEKQICSNGHKKNNKKKNKDTCTIL